MFLSRVKNLVQESAARRSQAREQSQQQRRTKSPGIGETATDEQLKETEKEKETATTTKPQTSTSPAPSTSGFWSLYRRDRGAAGSEKEKDKEKEGDGGSSQEPEREKTELVPPKTETEKEKEKEREPRTVDEAIAQFFEKNGRRQTKTFTGRDRLPLRRLEGTGATRREVCGRVEVSIECGCALASRTPSLLLHIDGSEAKAEDPVAWPQTEQGGGGRFVFASAQGGGEGVNAKIENGRAIFSFEIRDIRSSLFILLVERERLLQRLRVVGRICVFPSGWSAFDGGHPGETHLLPQRKRRGGGSSPQWVEFFPVSKRGALLPSAAERTAGLMANVYKFEAGVKFAKGSAMARPRSPLGVLQLSVSFSLAVPALKALSVPLSAAAAGGEEGEQGQPGESRDKKGAAEGEEGDDFGVDILTIRRNFLRLGDALPFPVLLRIFLSSMPGLIFICALWAFICLTAEPWMWPVWVFTVILSNGVASHFLTLPAPPRVAHPSVEGLLLREYGGVAAAASVPPRTRPGGLLAGGERDLLESAGEGREDGEREIYRGSDAGGGQVDDGPFVARSNSSLSVVSPSPPRTQLNVNGRTTPPVSRSPPRRLLGGQAAKTAEAPISPRPVVVKQRETPKWLSDLAEDLGIPLPRQNPKSLLRPLPLLQRRRVLLWEDDRDLQGEEDASALSLRQKYRKVFYGVATFQSKCGEIASKAERLSNAFNFADVQISATIHASCALICVLLSVLLHLLPLRLFFAIAGCIGLLVGYRELRKHENLQMKNKELQRQRIMGQGGGAGGGTGPEGAGGVGSLNNSGKETEKEEQDGGRAGGERRVSSGVTAGGAEKPASCLAAKFRGFFRGQGQRGTVVGVPASSGVVASADEEKSESGRVEDEGGEKEVGKTKGTGEKETNSREGKEKGDGKSTSSSSPEGERKRKHRLIFRVIRGTVGFCIYVHDRIKALLDLWDELLFAFLSRIPDNLDLAHRFICDAQKVYGGAIADGFPDPVTPPASPPMSPLLPAPAMPVPPAYSLPSPRASAAASQKKEEAETEGQTEKEKEEKRDEEKTEEEGVAEGKKKEGEDLQLDLTDRQGPTPLSPPTPLADFVGLENRPEGLASPKKERAEEGQGEPEDVLQGSRSAGANGTGNVGLLDLSEGDSASPSSPAGLPETDIQQQQQHKSKSAPPGRLTELASPCSPDEPKLSDEEDAREKEGETDLAVDQRGGGDREPAPTAGEETEESQGKGGGTLGPGEGGKEINTSKRASESAVDEKKEQEAGEGAQGGDGKANNAV